MLTHRIKTRLPDCADGPEVQSAGARWGPGGDHPHRLDMRNVRTVLLDVQANSVSSTRGWLMATVAMAEDQMNVHESQRYRFEQVVTSRYLWVRK